jgi:hypothetical protein
MAARHHSARTVSPENVAEDGCFARDARTTRTGPTGDVATGLERGFRWYARHGLLVEIPARDARDRPRREPL